jgi:hypothetical protein
MIEKNHLSDNRSMFENMYNREVRYPFLEYFKLLFLFSLLILVSCQPSNNKRSSITITDYRVFYDGQDKGISTISGHFLFQDDTLKGLFTGGPVEDMTTGKRPYLICSADSGKTWSEPLLFGEELLINPAEWEKEALRLAIYGPTTKGTLICSGDQFAEGDKGSGALKDPQWRNHTLNIGRKEKNSANWLYTRYQSGTFLGEQFMDGWLQLPSGRLVFTIWGAKNKGENWRCGVMLSDDDGITWKYRDVAYEPKVTIRNKPEVIAGFNEQSLFLTDKGKLISIIRGRDNLGRVIESPKDTWFLRSESTDNGETWSDYELTNIPGTGAAAIGLTLPDGSLLHACRIPYSRDLYKLPEPEFYGLHFARSFDEGKTWKTEQFIQRDPEGKPFKNYYNAMNGQFLKVNDNEWLYIFGHFDNENKVFRILSCRLIVQ